uniref:hypothetical protein n=1 Tax=Pseudomonas tructae TaxID=2518644 RepID=UPI002D7785C4|nr:hypothetical protein [Pseudomonas tructae]
MKYRLHGKENGYAIGRYANIGLKEARELHVESRKDRTRMISLFARPHGQPIASDPKLIGYM